MSRLFHIPLRAVLTVLVAVVATIAASSYVAVGAEEATGDDTATNPGQGHDVHKFIGSWRLVSFEARTATGQVIYPFGQDADGVGTFTTDGRMSASLWKAGRQSWAINDQQKGTPEENTAAVRSYITYLGHYEIDSEARTLSTYVEQSVFPNWNGTVQVRFYEFSDHGNKLELTTPPIPFGGTTVVGALVWKRM